MKINKVRIRLRRIGALKVSHQEIVNNNVNRNGQAKMKTAKIDVYKMYGTMRYVADVWHKGKLIMEFNESHINPLVGTIQGLEQAAIEYVLQNGFTNYKLIN